MDVEGAEYIAVAFVEDIQTETEEDIDIFFLKVEEDSEFSYIENDENLKKYLLHLKRFWMSKSKNRMTHTGTDTYPPSFYSSLIQRLMQQFQYIFHRKGSSFSHAQQIQKQDVMFYTFNRMLA